MVGPERWWDETYKDLFGSLPGATLAVFFQDLTSCYPRAKLIKSINARSVIPVLEDVYDTFGNLTQQKSDIGIRFNCKEMEIFTENRNIEQVKESPGYPFPNKVETIMKSLGK